MNVIKISDLQYINGSNGDTYKIDNSSGEYVCNCPGFSGRGYCKHVRRYVSEGIVDHQAAELEKGYHKPAKGWKEADFKYIFEKCSVDTFNQLKKCTIPFEHPHDHNTFSSVRVDKEVLEPLKRTPYGFICALRHHYYGEDGRTDLKRDLASVYNIKVAEARRKTLQERKAVKRAVNKEINNKYQSPLGTTYWSVLYELDSNGDMKYHVKNGKTAGNHPTSRTLNWGPLICYIEKEWESGSHEISRQEFGKVKLPIRRQGGNECYGAFDSMQEAIDACYTLGKITAKKLKLTLHDYRKEENSR